MELSVENIIEKGLSTYEIERNKPMPTLIHGAIQFNIGFEIKTNYGNQFRIVNEVLLDTKPLGSTPDVILYPQQPLDYKNDPSRRTDAPLLAVEIQSASQSTKNMVEKLEPYFYFGIKSCWIVVPDFQGIFVYDNPFEYTFFHGNDVLKDVTLGIEINLKNVFEQV